MTFDIECCRQYNNVYTHRIVGKGGFMLNQMKMHQYSKSELVKVMKAGYEEMGTLNRSLSEEGLYEDIEDLKKYEKNLLESE